MMSSFFRRLDLSVEFGEAGIARFQPNVTSAKLFS
jgi:hypothetical protein